MNEAGSVRYGSVRTSLFSTVLSMALVLFVLGLLGLLLLSSRKITTLIRENITFSLYLKNDMKEVEIMQLKKNIDRENFVLESNYTSKEEAAKKLQQELDPSEDFIQFLDGYNPLPSSLDIRLTADYANPDSMAMIEKKLKGNPYIMEMDYHKSLVHLINENINKISIVLLGFSVLLFIILLALINNTIRLAIQSKRFLIRTMQLVGATSSFISRPFLAQGILAGIFGSFIAILLLTGILYWLHREIPELFEVHDAEMVLFLYIAVISTGIAISLISNFFAVRRYLHVQQEELY